MGFDPITFVAQIVNLFVLIWLLKRFLYKPVLKAVETRQADILGRVDAARQAQQEALEMKKELEKEKKSFLKQKEEKLARLMHEIQNIRAQKLAAVKKEAQIERFRAQEELNKRLEESTELTERFFIDFFPDILQKGFEELANTSAFTQTLERFLEKARTLSEAEKEEMRAGPGQWYLTLSHPLPREKQETLKTQIRIALNLEEKTRIPIRTDDSLIIGARLSNGARILEWNMKKYLMIFEEHLKKNTARIIMKGEQ